MIKLENVQKSYLNKRPVFSKISMEIESGEFLFLTGVSGAGKSTIFKLLIGLEKPDTGKIYFQGKEVNQLPKREIPAHRRKIGVVFQDYKLLLNKTVAENIAVPLRIIGSSNHIIEQKIKIIAKRMGIEELLTQQIQSLSGGEQQLVAIARASVHSPQLILADEPTANLDLKMANKIIKMLTLLNNDGTTIIIATHDINLIRSHSRRILLIKKTGLIEVH